MDNLWGLFLHQVEALKPSLLSKKPHFNYISAHYFFIIGLAILGSVVIYGSGRGDIAYVDSLFFAVGANTQAGLNTVNVNDLTTFQQVVIYLMSMASNPISMNSFVVFLRLYWFERRFQHIVQEARQRRGTLTKTKSKGKRTPGDVERGVNGRNIAVIHNGQKARMTNDGIVLDDPQQQQQQQQQQDKEQHQALKKALSNGNGNGSVNGSVFAGSQPGADLDDGRHLGITFATTVKRSDGIVDDVTKLPPMRSEAENLAILERQRQGGDEVLRIPGPRDAERGMRPTRVEENDVEEPEPMSPGKRRTYSNGSDGAIRPHMLEDRRQINFDEPPRPRRSEARRENRVLAGLKAFANAFSFLKIRVPRMFTRDRRLHHEENEVHVPHHHHSDGHRHPRLENLRRVFSRDREEGAPYLSWEPTLGRNSAFNDLTDEQREELGGIEYRSLKTLALILTCYFWGFSVLGVVCLLPWIIRVNHYGQIVDSVNQSRVWWGFFTPNSAFMDLGFTLTPDSMNSFNTAVLPMLLMSFLIVVGNTGFPVMLRFIIWLSSLFVPRGTGLWEELRFLLDHPRRCFTLLFPSNATWWLFWLLVILNGVDLIFFIILDIGAGPIQSLSGGIKVLDGFFQATSTRTAGFSCVNLADLHPGVQVSYMIMMYISVFPVAISMRRTNVYEEKSLGIWSQPEAVDDQTSDLVYVGAHLRRQLSFDLWYIFVGFFILSISEGPRLMTGDISMFAVLFEIVSAYGTVGMSLGYPTTDASLSSQFTTVGKLVIMAMMIRGRHRGLPYGLDRAILLPSESLNEAEIASDAASQLARGGGEAVMSGAARRNSATSAAPSGSIVLRRHHSRRNSNVLSSLMHVGPPVAAVSHAVSPGLSKRPTFPRSATGTGAVTNGGGDEGPSVGRTRTFDA